LASMYRLSANVLEPDDLRLAADALEAALRSVDEGTTEAPAYTARRILARYIMNQALLGQRDLDHLRDGALAYLAQFRMTKAA
jgi:hypothetical protein